MGCTNCPLCPVSAGAIYMAERGAAAGSFFIKKDGMPLTKPDFVLAVRQALQVTGHPYKNYAGHSFRIGAATTAAKAGIEDSTICTLGRWNSTAFLCYIRTPQEQLANLSTKLANKYACPSYLQYNNDHVIVSTYKYYYYYSILLYFGGKECPSIPLLGPVDPTSGLSIPPPKVCMNKIIAMTM